jgi:Carbohydrate family 9 binding domain-like
MHFFRFLCSIVIQLYVFSASFFVLVPAPLQAASGCTHYASPTGTGTGLSTSSPFKISNFWAVAAPGKTLCLADGTYTGDSSMIRPPSGLNGTATAPITIAAINDGKVYINGQNARLPMQLNNNSWWIIEGIDVANSNASVINTKSGASHNIIRRVCAWNANESQSTVWTINSPDNLLEDVCGFGTGRKIFSDSQGGDFTTLRRAWGMWERSLQIGPKSVFDISYNTRNETYENVIGTWDETAMGGVAIDQPKGILSSVGPTPNSSTNYCMASKFLGSIGYLRNPARASSWLGGLFGSRSVDCFEFRDIVLYLQEYANLRPILAQIFDGGSPSTGVVNAPVNDRKLVNVTEIGGAASSIYSDPINGWKTINRLTVDAVPTGTTNIWNGSSTIGARVCKRYKDRVLTNEPLWPWPMNQRIIDAMTAAGKKPVDVTKTMEDMFGPIPTQCKGSGVASTPPPPTTLSGYLTSLKTLSAINMDGSLSESVWSSANSVTFSNPSRSDNSVRVSTLWNDTTLYFAYDVTDTNQEALNDPTNLWRDDGVEIYLDTQNNKSTTMDTNDYAVRTNINDLVDLPGVIVKTRFKTSGYTQEIQIPWSVISTVPYAGKVLGLLLANNDRDNNVINQFDWLNVISTGRYSQPNLWGSLILSGTTVGPSVPSSPVNLTVAP